MLILATVQAIIAVACILFGLVALFGIGITGLLFLLPGAAFAATAGALVERTRAATAAALCINAVLAFLAVRKLEALAVLQQSDTALGRTVGAWDYVAPSAALFLVAVGVVGVLLDWRTLRSARWV